MSYSNPTMDALARGGAVANQGMSVANSMMQGVQKAMDSTSDLTFKMDALLKEEQARKFEQGIQSTKLLMDQYQFGVTSQLDKERLDAQKKLWTSQIGRNSLAEKKFKYEQKQDTTSNALLRRLIGDGSSTGGSNIIPADGVNTLIPPVLPATKLTQEEIDNLGSSGSAPSTLDTTPFKPSIAPVGIAAPEATEQYYSQAKSAIDNEIMQKQQRAAELQKASVGLESAEASKVNRYVNSLNTDIKTLQTKRDAYDTQFKNKRIADTKQSVDGLTSKFNKIVQRKSTTPTGEYKEALTTLEKLKNLEASAQDTKSKNYIAKTINSLESQLNRRYAPETTGMRFVDDYISKNPIGSTNKDAYVAKFANQLAKAGVDAKTQEAAIDNLENKYTEFETTSVKDASFYSTLSGLKAGVNPSSDNPVETGQFTLVENLYKKGNPQTKQIVDNVVGNISTTGISDPDDLLGAGFGGDNEDASVQLYEAFKRTPELSKYINDAYKAMKKANIFKTANYPISDKPDDKDNTLNKLNPDELTVFFYELSRLLDTDTKNIENKKLADKIKELTN